MSYNIDHVECLMLKAKIKATKLYELLVLHGGELAEGNFLEDHSHDVPDQDGYIKLKKLSWHGEGSGNSFHETFMKLIVPHIEGEVEAVLTWEGGDSVSGLHIKDGVATEMDVAQKLTPKKDR
jgi:hypothetical protein